MSVTQSTFIKIEFAFRPIHYYVLLCTFSVSKILGELLYLHVYYYIYIHNKDKSGRFVGQLASRNLARRFAMAPAESDV